MRLAVRAVYGIRWNRAALTSLTTGRINYDLARLRNSEFPEMEYERLPTFLKGAYAASSAFPADLLEWRTIAGQIRIDLSAGAGAVLTSATFLLAQGLSNPLHL